jgi:hypothetical protein
MDPITLIVTALAAGAAIRLRDTASSAVEDAYASLKALTRKRLAGRSSGELALARHEASPETWGAPLAAELSAAGADGDAALVAAAHALMSLVDAAGARSGKYNVAVRASHGVQIGDGSTQAIPGAPPQRDALEPASYRGRESATPVPPPHQVGYDDLVRGAFAQLVQPGRLLFNPPDRMQLDHTERVEVRLTRTLELDAELREHLRGRGEPQLEEIPAAPLMAVTLKGEGFRITPYSDEEQSVTQDGITTWEFDIRALKRGQQRLVMGVSLRIPVPGQPMEHKSIPVREATIDVQVRAPALIGHFVSGNWQWFIGTAIAIAAVVIAVIYH